MSRAVRPEAAWRWFPAAMLGSIAVVFAVNGAMIYAAVSTFPGQAGDDGFDLSNAYARVQDAAARQAALGWQLALEPDAGGHLVARVTGGGGAPLFGVAVAARAERPVGPAAATPLRFDDGGGGRLVSLETLPAGRWTVQVTIVASGETLTTTRRLTLP